MSSYSHFYKQLENQALHLFPSLSEVPDMAWDHLISPLELRLPATVYATASAAITALDKLSRTAPYVSALEDSAAIVQAQARNRSVLMAYDFHTNEAGECFLVEINTNASGYLLATLMLKAHGAPSADRALEELRNSFHKEAQLSGLDPNAALSAAISDEDIPTQKMYPEFLMYRDWFKGLGWKAELNESRAFLIKDNQLLTEQGVRIDFVYNRSTDFYLQDPAHAALREAYLRGLAVISPNPGEYWRLADKERLVQLTRPDFLAQVGASVSEQEAIQKVLIPTFEIGDFASQDEIWAERKSLFFKPKRSFGGKSVYRGESVSRKVFERLIAEDILIQRYRPAQRMPTDDPRSVLNNWKFDVRFYVYAGAIQLVAARIYQGQVTNFSSPMGGFTFVQF